VIIYFDTEDNSLQLALKGKNLFDKRITQIAALTSTGKEFYNKGDSGAFLSWAQQFEGAVRVYAHNAQYDIGALLAEKLPEMDLTLVGGRMIRARWSNLIFLDSFNIWPMSLKKIGDAVGLKKLDLNERSRKYVFRDVEIMKKAMTLAQKFTRENRVADISATLGGLCVKIWKAQGGGNWYCDDAFFRQGYYGGRVELFSNGGKGNLYYVDVNSLYPWTMMLPFPDEVEPVLTLDGWGMARVKIEIPKCVIAPLPVRREDGSIYYPYGVIDGGYRESADYLNGVWTFHEIHNAIAHGAKVLKIYEAYGTKTAYACYRAFVTRMYNLRKDETDEGKRTFLKLLMNNLYGQLVMSGKVTRSLRLDNCIARSETGAPLLDDNGEPVLTRDGWPFGDKLLADIQMPLPDHTNILHGAYVASYARLRLQSFLRKIPSERLVYCDTDSIIFFWPDQSPLPFPISNELGDMKLESRLKACYVYGPKVYRLDITKDGKLQHIWKAKGVPQRASEFDQRQFDAGKIKELKTLARKFIEDGHAEYLQPFKMRESVVYFDDWKKHGQKGKARKLAIWHQVEKHRITTYDKKFFRKGHFLPKAHTVNNPEKMQKVFDNGAMLWDIFNVPSMEPVKQAGKPGQV
jgi:hypothetical protein